MSTFTTQLRYIIEQPTQDRKWELTNDEKIDIGIKTLFNFDYPFWIPKITTDSKEFFERRFVERYYQREIGAETTEQFKFNLKATLYRIMPRYIRRYETQSKEYNWMWNTEGFEDIIENIAQNQVNNQEQRNDFNSAGNTADQNNSNYNNKVLNSDLPQHTVSSPSVYGEDYTESEGNTAATANQDTTFKSDSETKAQMIDDLLRNRKNDLKRYGNFGQSFTSLLIEYRESIINVTEEIIDELEQLFLMVY